MLVEKGHKTSFFGGIFGSNKKQKSSPLDSPIGRGVTKENQSPEDQIKIARKIILENARLEKEIDKRNVNIQKRESNIQSRNNEINEINQVFNREVESWMEALNTIKQELSTNGESYFLNQVLIAIDNLMERISRFKTSFYNSSLSGKEFKDEEDEIKNELDRVNQLVIVLRS